MRADLSLWSHPVCPSAARTVLVTQLTHGSAASRPPLVLSPYGTRPPPPRGAGYTRCSISVFLSLKSVDTACHHIARCSYVAGIALVCRQPALQVGRTWACRSSDRFYGSPVVGADFMGPQTGAAECGRSLLGMCRGCSTENDTQGTGRWSCLHNSA